MLKALLPVLVFTTLLTPVAQAANGKRVYSVAITQSVTQNHKVARKPAMRGPDARKPVTRPIRSHQPVVRVPGYRDSFRRVRHTVIHRGNRYRFDQGVFFRLTRNGYVAVAAPVGAVVPALPPALVLFDYGPEPIFKSEGVFYRQVRNGYVVIKRPRPRS